MPLHLSTMKRILTIAIFILSSCATFAQTQKQSAYYEDPQSKGLGLTLYKLFGTPKYAQIFSQIYLHSCYFVKFSVDSRGKVFDPVCNETTPDSIKQFLIEGILSTSGKWHPALSNGSAVCETFLLPVTFELDLGPRKDYRDDHNYSILSLQNMLLFGQDTGSHKPFDPVPATPLLSCTILNPLSFTRPH